MVKFLAGVLFNKDTTECSNIKDENGNITGKGKTCIILRKLVDEGKINEAENLLFSEIEKNKDIELLEVALDFYGYLNEKEDNFLEENGFSHQEILEGLQDIQKMYNIEEI
ncbi:MAG: hypothetical protein J1E56_05000 [Ruminococcus sp.]|nr:hypothetical protein [Ruminococcus sp.]